MFQTELPYLRKKSDNNFHIFASSYCFINDGIDNGIDEEDRDDTNEGVQLIFGRLFKHYLSKQCSNIIPLLGEYFKCEERAVHRVYGKHCSLTFLLPPPSFQTCFIVFVTFSSILKHPNKIFF